MSCLANVVQANPDSYFFALSGSGGGGGGGSTLQSPASITPAVNGQALLNVVQTTGSATPAAAVLVSSQNGNDAIVQIDSTAGGNASLLLSTSGVGGKAVFIANDGASTGSLAIGDNASGDVYMLIDTVSNDVSIGAAAGGAIPSGTVTTQCSLLVKDFVGGANAVAISPTTAAASVISQTVASGGNLNLGSSVANPAGLTVSDVARVGIFNYVQINGTPDGVPLFLSGAQGEGGQCAVHADAAPGSGQLLLGADNVNTTQIVLSSAATTINNLGGAPQVLLASQPTIAAGASGLIPTPTGEGLYCIMGCSTPVSSGQSRQGQFSVMCYVNSTGRVQMGGSGLSDLGSVGGSDSFILLPQDGAAQFFYQNNGSQSMLNYSIVAFKISGAITGAF